MDTSKIRISELYVEITNKCNFDCIYCYNDSSVKKNDFLPVAVYIQFINKVKELGLKRIVISGGEPTLHCYLTDIIKTNHDLGLEQVLITNGTRITEELLSEVASKKIIFTLTIDGNDEESNDSLRGSNSYATTMRAIKLLASKGLANQISIRSNLHFKNYKNIYPIAKLLNDIGVGEINFSLLSNMGRATNIETINSARHSDIISEIYGSMDIVRSKLDIISNFAADTELGCPYQTLDEPLALRIDACGSIYPCQSVDDLRFSLGNIHLASVSSLKKSILDFSDYTISRQSKIEKCKKCAYQSFCNGGCVASSLTHSGNPLVLDVEKCVVRKKKIRKMFESKGVTS